FYNRDAGERRDGAGGCRRQPSQRDADRRPGAPRQRLSDPCRPCAGDRGDPAGDGRAAGWETVTRLFGTDGIRGVANEEPLTPDLAYRVGRQLGATPQAQRGRDSVKLVIGRDTRRSGPLLEAAMTAGVLSAGGECFAAGVLPTPGIALVTRALDADGGIVLSASHNPFADNGIKLFSAGGTKFPDAWEHEIEARLEGADGAPQARGAGIGRLVAYDRAEAYYVEFLSRCFPLDLGGLTIALDCAHGATYRVAPRLFRRLGARVLSAACR